VSATLPQLPNDAVLDVRPGDQNAATQVEEWLQAYASSRDPQLREWIILAYVGLADRLASRYRTSRGTTPEDLRQTARAGLITAVDRYDPGHGTSFVAYAVACVIGELKRHLRDTSWRLHVPRPRKELSSAAVPGGRCAVPAPGPLPHHPRTRRTAGGGRGGGLGGVDRGV
jgi:RNA polymerase sigma-B factor